MLVYQRVILVAQHFQHPYGPMGSMGSYGVLTNVQVEVLVLSRGKFERLLGSMDDLQQHGGPSRDSQWHMDTALGPNGNKASMMFDVRTREKSFAVVPHDSLILMDIFFSRLLDLSLLFFGDHMITACMVS